MSPTSWTSTLGATTSWSPTPVQRAVWEASVCQAFHSQVRVANGSIWFLPGDHPFPAPGKDATEDFEEIGHSKTAKDMLKEYYVGEFVGGALPVKTKKQNGTLAGSTTGTTSLSTALLRAVLPLLVLALAILYALNR
ncbi:CYB1 [Auxenochlorella protothecoides x Auxenochlorella symbiontica]